MDTLAIVGLGNPGPGYARSRHNTGFRCVDRYADEKGARFSRTACNARLAAFEQHGARVVLAKPRTFMNLSGKSAQALVHSLHIPVERLLVVYDDVDLPLGRLRVRASGGPGGHNGVRSIIECLNSDRFPRVRVGIGRPADAGAATNDDSLIDYVLGRFAPDEEAVIHEAITRVCDVLDCIVAEGVDAAMNRYNSVV
ncbi:MAG: aminoacyl-tRNA hydrolase [Dehalococcoidia bacterium]|nr:aminoacyl-tRNA hydrolase [Dehalococcoidia bacterium]